MISVKTIFAAAVLLSVAMAPAAFAQSSSSDNSAQFARPDYKPYDDNEQMQQENAKLVQDGAKALKEGDFAKAEARFAKALKNNPDNPMLNYLMGVAKIGRGEKGAAVGYLENAVRNDPKNVDYRALLARLLAEGGDMEGARAQLAAMKAMKSDCSGSCDAGKLETAISQLESALA